MEGNCRNSPRKKLADISNLPLRKRLSSQDKIPEQFPAASKEYLERIQKENLALTKMLAERNKIIEITGVEIQKLRMNVRKMHQQNQLLAQGNSKMLAELNSNKDRVKTLQHELGCIKGLLYVRKFEAEEQPRTNMCQDLNDEVKPMKCEEARDLSLGKGDVEKARNHKKRLRSKSVGSSEQVQSEDKTENKRSCVRRQSARFKPEALKLGEDSFAVQDKCALRPPISDPVQENGSTSICISSDDLHCNPSSRFEPIPFERTSLSRPSREAAKKVQSYKEIPVNIKMRRPQ
ncbi:SHUGOSHIN 2 [Solanum dulcamara]|uniref:SHUGOSHIN 2 n=1 Tax=Solanum dulcamara TaxID=45834 RepID=UPI0024851AA0|nr:SHUGOSHIN 2 [Solanum dulcamara]XP_055830191.1 SHUGOSHIN 2 [Solanum dulcamara]